MRSRLVAIAAIVAVTAAGCGPASAPPPTAPTSVPTAGPTPSATPSAEPSPTSAVTPSPGPEATMPVTWKTSLSTAHGYSVDTPADWVGTPASMAWPADGFSFPDDPAVDKWARPDTQPSWVLLIIATQPLKAGETATQRIARLDADNGTVCQMSNRRAVTIAGVAGRREDGFCFGSDYISEAAVVHAGRSYLIYVLSGGQLSATTLATYERFLKSFRFT
jgi:hypothetical protein